MTIASGDYYDFDDVMIRPQLSNKLINSRDDVSLVRPFTVNESSNRPYRWEGVPIIAANMDTVGTMEMAQVMMQYNCCTALHKHYTALELAEFFNIHRENEHLLFYTMGINRDSIEKFTEFTQIYGMPKNICIDVANGYAPRFIEFISRMRDMASDSIIMAGNVVTADVTYALITAGASIVKVGIGSGSACLTRRVTGVGSPQLSAVLECANAAHGLNGLICSDGGCVYPGDVSKAFGGGADFVMLGGMLAGHDECGGKKITIEGVPIMIDEYYAKVPGYTTEVVYGRTKPKPEDVGKDYEVLRRQVQDHYPPVPIVGTKNGLSHKPKFEEKVVSMEFYGMSSNTAMEKHNGGMAKYKASEGRTLSIPYKGGVSDTIEEILGGVRSTMTYVGALELKELAKCTQFIPHSRQLNTSLIKYES